MALGLLKSVDPILTEGVRNESNNDGEIILCIIVNIG